VQGCDVERQKQGTGEMGSISCDTRVVFWGELQFVGELHGSCRGVDHVHQHRATAMKTNTL